MNPHRYFRQVIALTALFLAASAVSGCVPHSTGPTEVGVRTIKFSFIGRTGVEEKAYPPGSTYFFAPFLNDWHTFDTRLITLEMTGHGMRGERPSRDDLLFKTIDGNDISLDIVISYRIDPQKAPFILKDVAKNNLELRENIMRTVARSKPRDIFGELNTERFYSAEERNKKAETAQEALNQILTPYGVIVERVGIGDYRFNADYQKAIEDRMVADQLTEKYRSATKATEQEYLKRVEVAKGDVARMRAEADGQYNQAVIEADAKFERQKRLAEAIRAEGLSEAEAVRQMNEALMGSGGESVVKLQIAQALQGKKLMLLPMGSGLDVRSTDINGLLSLYGIKKIGESAPASPTPAPAAPPVKLQ
ncbi:MAG TPA: SPFH domain-containing protein [Candidatus Hydrogenedentes bacterium]|nr:SPFH domain-containing protein [Candidatus Hydrogenedentota bacterium]